MIHEFLSLLLFIQKKEEHERVERELHKQKQLRQMEIEECRHQFLSRRNSHVENKSIFAISRSDSFKSDCAQEGNIHASVGKSLSFVSLDSGYQSDV